MHNLILKLLTLTCLIQASQIFGAAQHSNTLLQIQKVNLLCTEYLVTGDIQTAYAIYKIDSNPEFFNWLCSRLTPPSYTLPEIDTILRARIRKTGHSNLAGDHDLWEAIRAIKAENKIEEVRTALQRASTNYPMRIAQNQDWQKAANFFKLIDNAKRMPNGPRAAWEESKSP